MKDKIEESRLDFYRRWGRLERPYLKWQFEQFSAYIGQRIGDIGCGIGNFVEFFKEKKLYLGFDPDRELTKEFKRLHKAKNVRLALNGDITIAEAAEEMKAERLDTIICINTLEHIKDDERALFNMVDAVSRNGHICILVPAFSWLYGSLDELDGHYRRYSKEELLRLIKDLDVKVIKCYYMNFFGGLGWFVKGRVVKEKTHGNENYIITNMLLPIISFVERFIKPSFGLSLILVLKKI